ncbi:Txe/YoeB family addiction module toxin [Mucilaginibacter mali]|uniref:Putative mRNA interferase YoeB n=1 Tax=Mucilaginibacter mali TaxID=2740462 RepID=A0A7D4TYR6_9SPHI|nr:Txe/YoeB family addiction module toxin [Mucilaginibacter mali]QKJ31577.1 Txe/YoeB family addiction module toxin [Mucilaginibacter mali]
MGKYRVVLSKDAVKDISYIKRSGDTASMKKVDIIISELHIHPETGTGKPERLKFDYAGYWSRRINKKDRLVYRIDDEIITVNIVSAIGHYGDK